MVWEVIDVLKKIICNLLKMSIVCIYYLLSYRGYMTVATIVALMQSRGHFLHYSLFINRLYIYMYILVRMNIT